MHLLCSGVAFRSSAAPLIGCGEPVIVRFSERAVYLPHHHFKSARAVVAVVERNRGADITEIAKMGKKKMRTARQGDAVARGIAREAFAKRLPLIAEVVAFAVRRPVPAVVARERGNTHEVPAAR